MIGAVAQLAIEDIREARGRLLEDAVHYIGAPGAEFGRWHAALLGLHPDAVREQARLVLEGRFGRAVATQLWVRCGGVVTATDVPRGTKERLDSASMVREGGNEP
jgi:hypothetical protein